ncbi:MAG: FAD-binding oxidoreductase, partial [Anaerolineales bacterium]|nr:FAD-binding oxidoreductase [Anaerolineales bacterium]
MTFPKTADALIIGGGVMGASAAYHLAARGQKNIVLLEKEEFFGQGATGRCAGGVRYQFGTEINIRLSLESLPMLERFKEEIGQEIDYRQCGYLFALTDEKDVATFKRNVALQHKLGVETEWLSGDEIRKRRAADPQAAKLAVRVTISEGTYLINEALRFEPEDSGSKEAPVIYQAAPNSKPVISGGRHIT